MTDLRHSSQQDGNETQEPMPSAREIAVARRMGDLLADAGLPAPEEIQHEHGLVRFLWHSRKVAVVVDVDEADEATS